MRKISLAILGFVAVAAFGCQTSTDISQKASVQRSAPSIVDYSGSCDPNDPIILQALVSDPSASEQKKVRTILEFKPLDEPFTLERVTEWTNKTGSGTQEQSIEVPLRFAKAGKVWWEFEYAGTYSEQFRFSVNGCNVTITIPSFVIEY